MWLANIMASQGESQGPSTWHKNFVKQFGLLSILKAHAWLQRGLPGKVQYNGLHVDMQFIKLR